MGAKLHKTVVTSFTLPKDMLPLSLKQTNAKRFTEFIEECANE